MLPHELFTTSNQDSVEFGISNSLRFRSSASAYLSKSFASAGNRQKWTWAAWVKRGTLGTQQTLFAPTRSAANISSEGYIEFNTSNQLVIQAYTTQLRTTTQVFRDPLAWYHIVVAMDTTKNIAEDRLQVYVNGVKVTSFAASAALTLNANYAWNQAVVHEIGRGTSVNSSRLFDGYMSDVYFIDGQALTPSAFGNFSAETRQWTPILYDGTFGSNGFYLDFKDNTNLTNLGYDKSGNSNHWTCNNISLTAGMTYDSMDDNPTNNFAVLNPFNSTIDQGISNANLTINAFNQRRAAASFAVSSGKWYWEVTYGNSNGAYIGISLSRYDQRLITVENLGTRPGEYSWNHIQQIYVNTVFSTGYGSTLTTGDIVGVALDLDAGTLTFYKNGLSQGLHSSGLTGEFVPALNGGFGELFTGHCNFGQRPFAYEPPAGHQKLCSKNLPTPTITRGETGFDIATYTGNGGNIQVGENQFPIYNYLIDRSLRFKGTNSNFSRTFLSSNASTWTWSGWVKRTNTGAFDTLYGASTNNYIAFNAGNALVVRHSGTDQIVTTQLFNDTSSWFHILYRQTTGTSELYVNGVLVGNSSTIGTVFNTNVSHQIGSVNNSNYLQGYMAEVYFIDGQSLAPTSFGEWDINGYWVPKAYTGTYGTNGFYLDFEDTSAVANLGFDKSSSSNNWTPNNFSLTSDSTNDSMVDSPTNNYAVLDSLTATYSSGSMLNGGLSLSFTRSSGTGRFAVAAPTILHPSNLDIYFEITINSLSFASGAGVDLYISNQGGQDVLFRRSTVNIYNYNGVNTSTSIVLAANNVIGFYVNRQTNQLVMTINGSALGTLEGWSSSLQSIRVSGGGDGSAAMTVSINFGQRSFSYTPPTGSKTLSMPHISEYTDDLESPDLVWIKSRSAAQNHMLFDSIRGPGKFISSNLTTVETTDVNSLISFNKNGFYLGNNAVVNTLNNTYIAWMWKSNATTVSNTSGTITSQVRANPGYGFSVVNFTATGANATVGHGLGLPPVMIISKAYNNATPGWNVWHSALSGSEYLVLNTTAGKASLATMWNSQTPNSTTFSIGTSWLNNYQSIAYCFSEIEGFSKFGSYVGNGNADGPFVYCGFKPKYILIKRTDTTGSWTTYDSERQATNVVGTYLLLDTTGIETGTANVDILANGFKLRSTLAAQNASNGAYIFAAFAESPFKYSTAR